MSAAGRLVLRPIARRDAAALHALDRDPAVRRHTFARAPDRAWVEDVLLPRMLGVAERHPGLGFFAALDTAESQEEEGGAFIGWFHLRPESQGDVSSLELGFRLRRASWGQGIATEGARAMLSRAFGHAGTRRVVALTRCANSAAIRVLEKAGLEAVARVEHAPPADVAGDPHPAWRFELTRASFEARRAR